jgi:hypothetical protein
VVDAEHVGTVDFGMAAEAAVVAKMVHRELLPIL